MNIDLLTDKTTQLKHLGIQDINVVGYELTSPYSRLNFDLDKNNNTIRVNMIATKEEENRRKGHAKHLLAILFEFANINRYKINIGPYTTSGKNLENCILRLSEEYGVHLI